jgi:hypothetical protein
MTGSESYSDQTPVDTSFAGGNIGSNIEILFGGPVCGTDS